MSEKIIHTVLPNEDLYYQHSSHAWLHKHDDGTENVLRLVEPYRLKCESCGEEWKVRPPDAMWDERRERRVPEVLGRIQPTDDPLRWRCPERTPGDGRVYQIWFDEKVNRWLCDCRDSRDFEKKAWACKHVRAVIRRTAES